MKFDLTEGHSQMFTSLLRCFHAWRQYETAVDELSNLSDRELADIRITRLDIRRVAWKSSGSDPPSDQLDRITLRPPLTLCHEYEQQRAEALARHLDSETGTTGK